MNSNDFISNYLEYASDTEAPAIFHRWSILSTIGAYLGRQFYFSHGHFTIYPNMYVMLMGSPGTRKSTSIKLAKKILTGAGYNSIAADKSTKEKFILDLAGSELESSADSILDQNLWGGTAGNDAHIFVMADEFNDFFGNNILDFVSFLGTLWDYSGVYKNRIKNGPSVEIHNPTVSLLGGNTPTSFAATFPAEIFGQGFFSRILLIHGEPNGKRIAFPTAPDQSHTDRLIESLQAIKLSTSGSAILSTSARTLLEKIYRVESGISDTRFSTYATRRFSHLIKLCLIHAAARNSAEIADRDVIYANTVLHYAEQFMPRALGEFGRAKSSAVADKIISVIEQLGVHGVVPMKDIWPHVHMDLEKFSDLATIVHNLIQAQRIQWAVSGDDAGALPKKSLIEAKHGMAAFIDYSFLTEEERRYVK